MDGRISLSNVIEALKEEKGELDNKILQVEQTLSHSNIKSAIPEYKRKVLEREASYNIVCNEVNSWEPIIKKNREATQLILKKSEDSMIPQSFGTQLDSKRISELNGLKLPKINENNFIDSIKNDPSDQNHPLIDKYRHLLLYKELKAKRVKKIKSKTYRGLKKKQRELESQKNLWNKLKGDKDAIYDEIEKLERQRAEERASLKHKANNKYAKLLQKYADNKSNNTAQMSLNLKRREAIDKLREIRDTFMNEEMMNKEEALRELEEMDSDDGKDEFEADEIIAEFKGNSGTVSSFKLSNNINSKEPDNMIEGLLQKQDRLINKEIKELKENLADTDDFLPNNESPEQPKERYSVDKEKTNQLNIYDELSHIISSKENQSIPKINSINTKKKENMRKEIKLRDEDVKLFEKDSESEETESDIDSCHDEDNSIENDFIREKQNELEEEAPIQRRPTPGWGSWTGTGVKEPFYDYEKAKIEQKRKIVI